MIRTFLLIGQFPILSKLIERLVARQLMRYLSSFDLLPSLQSGLIDRAHTSSY